MKYYLALPLLLIGAISSRAQVKINDNTNLVISSGANLVLNDLSLTNGNQNLIGDGKIILSGVSNATEVSSTGSIKNLTINKDGATVKLASKLVLPGTLALSAGRLDLNNFDLDLANTGELASENEINRVIGTTGFITRQATLNAPVSVNPGNLGVVITSAANLGLTTIKRGNYALSDGSNLTIQRFFDITPTNNTGLNATLRFTYLDADLGSLQENQLKLITSANGGSTWNAFSGANINAASNYAEQTGLNSFGRYSLSNSFTTLPLNSMLLTGKQTANGVNLKWTTAGEVNVSHFLLEKSSDGQLFRNVTRVASLSNLRQDNSYETLDKNPLKGINYYRVKSVDLNGDEQTADPIVVNYDLANSNALSIYPNPTAKTLFGSFYTDSKQATSLKVISITGKVILSKAINAQEGSNDFSIDVSQIPTGSYFLKIDNNTTSKTLKFIKN